MRTARASLVHAIRPSNWGGDRRPGANAEEENAHQKLGQGVSLLMFGMVVVVFGDVIFRYLFNRSWVFIQELEWHLFGVVYLLAARNPVKYKGGRSRIVYIGTTRKGVRRISGSAAHHAEEIMATRGLKAIDVFIVSCDSRSGLQTWEWLEDALIAEFRAEYEQLPRHPIAERAD